MKASSIAAIFLLLPLRAVQADMIDAVKSPAGFGSKGYVWNKMTPEQIEVMNMTGDPVRGREAFRACQGCHKPDGVGLIDGTYPRLTGQHAVVIIKQVTDTRAGIRVNPKMLPFASNHAVSTQEIADIAAFLAAAKTPLENGKGPGDWISRGESLYQNKGCVKCHGKFGEGNEEKVYPVVAGQHYGYLLNEIRYVKKGIRGNSHPDMVKVLREFSGDDLAAVSDYMSRLPDYRQAMQKGARK